jgi:uncharacterized protein
MVFVRAPRVGTVKQRLGAVLGREAATEAYRSMVALVLEQIPSGFDVQLYYCPPDATAEVAHWLRPGWKARPQAPGDLGARMNSAFEEAFAEGVERAVLIGSDIPTLQGADLEEALAALGQHDLVLGPARDGGYWLVGLRQLQPELFRQMSWSTARVLRLTLDRAKEASLRVHLLRELDDIDTAEDWARFLAHTPHR